MADVITNMKVRFGADTKNFKKGLDEGKRSSQQFQKDAGGAFDSFAEAFGVNMGKIREGLNKVQQSLTGTTAAMKTSAAGSNMFTRALGVLKTALIATGIGALVVALGSLVSYFTKTQRGADTVSKVMKGLNATLDVVRDRVSALGEIIFKAFSNPKKAVSDLWEAIKTNIVNRFEGLITLFQSVGKGLESLWKRDLEGLKIAATEAGRAMIQVTTGFDETQQQNIANSIRNVVTEIKEETRAAVELEKARQLLERREIDFIKTKARLKDEISELILKTRDETIAAEERLKYIEKAQQLQKRLSDEEFTIAAERTRILRENQALGENMIEDDRALAEAEANLNDLRKQGNDTMRELSNRYNEMTNKVIAHQKAIQAAREAETAMFKTLETKGLEAPALVIPELETDKLLSKLKTDLGEAKGIIVDFSDVFNQTFSDLAFSFGESMGNLISGSASMNNFGNIVLGALGELAIKLGKISIATGTSMIAIKKSFSNPYTAIAAGIALVALGTAVKNAVSSAMSSGGGQINQNSFLFDSRGTSSDFGNTQPTAQSQPQMVEVVVSGQFTQRGSDMIATISETNKRSAYTR